MEYERFEEFSALISKLYRSIQKLKAVYADKEEMDVKGVHTLWLYLLLRYPQGLYASELAKKTLTNRSLVSREIDELIEKKMIRARDSQEEPQTVSEKQTPARKYGKRFVLTPKGEEVAKKVQKIAAVVQTAADRGISFEELEQMYITLEKIGNNFEDIVKGV